MKEDKLIDQSQLAESVAENIPYEFVDHFLVKPLDPIKVKKQFSTPVDKGTGPNKDANGIVANDFDEVTTEIKEVDSDYRKGVILKIPRSYLNMKDDDRHFTYNLEVGDVVIFKDTAGIYFDLVKDTKLVRYYEFVAKEDVND